MELDCLGRLKHPWFSSNQLFTIQPCGHKRDYFSLKKHYDKLYPKWNKCPHDGCNKYTTHFSFDIKHPDPRAKINPVMNQQYTRDGDNCMECGDQYEEVYDFLGVTLLEPCRHVIHTKCFVKKLINPTESIIRCPHCNTNIYRAFYPVPWPEPTLQGPCNSYQKYTYFSTRYDHEKKKCVQIIYGSSWEYDVVCDKIVRRSLRFNNYKHKGEPW